MKVYSSLLLAVISTQQVNAQNPGPCTLCIDGSTPPFLDNPVFDFGANNSTCADFAAGAATITVEDEASFLACRQLQDVGLSNCGCETPEELKTGCTLCPGGNDLLPDPLKEVIPQVTCGGISSVVERFEGEECRAYQQVIGGMCECPDAPTTKLNGDETCRVCVDRELDLPAGAVDLSEFGLDMVPCAFFETIANEDDETPCAFFQLSRANCCEMPTVPPTPPANLAELCATSTVSANFEAYLVCADACVEASCCVTTCSTNPTCFQYFPCAVLDTVDPPEPDSDGGDGGGNSTGTTNGPPVPPSNLAELCEKDTITSSYEAYLGCATECAEAECCLNTCSSSATCLQYLPCVILDSVDPPQPGTGEPTGSGGTDGSGTASPNATTVPVGGNATTPPTNEGGTKEDSGANGDSGLFVSFRLILSIVLTTAAVGIAEYGI